MQLNLKEQLQKNPLLAKVYNKLTLRVSIQLLIALIMLITAWQFYGFVQYIRIDSTGAYPNRPPSAEGFLPVAAFIALKALFYTGQIDTIHPAGLIILIATLVTAWVFRRALCSWICPIGTLSEFLGKLGKKLMGKNLTLPKWLDFSLLVLKYVLFFSIFKIFFLMPAEEAVNFMQIPYYSISDIKMFDFFAKISTMGITIIVLLLTLSVFIKSFWCRYLCPYGALLGVIGFFSPILLIKNDQSCIKCKKCNLACPNNVNVEGKKRLVLSTECTGCTSCVSACPQSETLQFKLFGYLPVKALSYSIAFLALFFGIILWAKATGHWDTDLTFYKYQMLDQAMSGGLNPGP